jgi:hypothetical protein
MDTVSFWIKLAASVARGGAETRNPSKKKGFDF